MRQLYNVKIGPIVAVVVIEVTSDVIVRGAHASLVLTDYIL